METYSLKTVSSIWQKKDDYYCCTKWRPNLILCIIVHFHNFFPSALKLMPVCMSSRHHGFESVFFYMGCFRPEKLKLARLYLWFPWNAMQPIFIDKQFNWTWLDTENPQHHGELMRKLRGSAVTSLSFLHLFYIPKLPFALRAEVLLSRSVVYQYSLILLFTVPLTFATMPWTMFHEQCNHKHSWWTIYLVSAVQPLETSVDCISSHPCKTTSYTTHKLVIFT